MDENHPMLGPRVYEIPYSCGKSYIGKIGRSFKDQLKEHMTNAYHNRIYISTIVEHFHNSRHLICFDKTSILAFTPFNSNCVITKALDI